jgi:choline transport protein
MISFAIPAVLLICSKRSSDTLTFNRAFKLPSAVGWVGNIVTVISALHQLGFLILPPSIPVTASGMSECPQVLRTHLPKPDSYAFGLLVSHLAVVGIISLLNWMIYAGKNHHIVT